MVCLVCSMGRSGGDEDRLYLTKEIGEKQALGSQGNNKESGREKIWGKRE